MKELLNYGVDLSKSKLLPIALTHTSYANEHNLISYERLEFLGDAVLELVSSDYIYKTNKYNEGERVKKGVFMYVKMLYMNMLKTLT